MSDINDKTPEVPKEETGKENIQKEAPKDKNPLGEGIKPALYIMFDENKNTFFVLGAPGFLDEPIRAYGALKIAEKNLDDFYKQKKSLKDSLTAGVKNFQNKMNMRRFINGV